MKIAEQNDQRLVLRQYPLAMIALMLVLTGGILAGLISADAPKTLLGRAGLLACALALLWVTHRYFPLTDTVFDRTSGLVVHAERRLTGQTLSTWPLDALEGAEVEANWSDGRRGTRLTLRIDGRRQPLDYGFGPGDLRPVEVAVNDWLTSPVP